MSRRIVLTKDEQDITCGALRDYMHQLKNDYLSRGLEAPFEGSTEHEIYEVAGKLLRKLET